MVPPCSDRISRVPPYSRIKIDITPKGLSPTMARLSRRFGLFDFNHWPGPRSLATTNGVSVDVLSSGYLDVSVPRVCLPHLCIQCGITLRWGFPIRKSTDQSLLSAPRSLSQSATSFIASQCQGIHEMPLLTLDPSHAGTSPCISCLSLRRLVRLKTKRRSHYPKRSRLTDQIFSNGEDPALVRTKSLSENFVQRKRQIKKTYLQ